MVVSIAAMLGLPPRNKGEPPKKVVESGDSEEDSPSGEVRKVQEEEHHKMAATHSDKHEMEEDEDENEEKDSFKVLGREHDVPVSPWKCQLEKLTLAPEMHDGSDEEEEDDDVSLSEDSVYLRMTEHDTPRIVEEIFRRMPTALNLVNSKTVNKQFFTGHGRTTNEEIYFRGDIITPALRGAMSTTAVKASAEIDLRSRQAACTQQIKLGSHVTPTETAAIEEDPGLKLTLLQRQHNSIEVERKRASHENGSHQEQVLPPRPVEMRDLMRNIPASTLDVLSSPRTVVQKPDSPGARSRPHSAAGSSSSSRPSSAVQPKAPDGSKPSHQRKRVSKDASFSDLADTPDLPAYTAPPGTHAHVNASGSPSAHSKPKSAHKATQKELPSDSKSSSDSFTPSLVTPCPNSFTALKTNILPPGSTISSPIGYGKHARRNSAYIISQVHGYQELLEEVSDSDEEEAEWDEEGLINGNKPIDATAEGKKKHWRHRRAIMGPTVGSAEENELRAAGTWKEERIEWRPKRQRLTRFGHHGGHLSRNRTISTDASVVETVIEGGDEIDSQFADEDALSAYSDQELYESDLTEQQERERMDAHVAAMTKRLAFREDYLAYKKALNDADSMQPFAWLNTAASHLDNMTLSMKLPLHAVEGGRNPLPGSPGYKDRSAQNLSSTIEEKPNVYFNKQTKDSDSARREAEKEPEPVYSIQHGAFAQFDTENTRQSILDPRDELLQADDDTDTKNSRSSAMKPSLPQSHHTQLYDDYYDHLYQGVLDKILLHGEAHKVSKQHTHLQKLDGVHQISSGVSGIRSLGPSGKGFPPHSPITTSSGKHASQSPEKDSLSTHHASSNDAAATTKAIQLDSWKKIQTKIAAMEREMFLPSNLKDEEKELNGPAPVLGEEAIAPTSRTQIFEVSKSTVAKGQQQLKLLIPETTEVVAPPPRVASLRPKALRERSATDPPVLPAGVRMPVIQTQHKRRWNQFSFVTPDIEAMAGLDVASLMEILLQSHNSTQPKDDHTKRRDSVMGLPDALAGKSRPNPRVLSSELMQLFNGFSKMDSNGDGLLSAEDMNEFVLNNHADTQLPLHVLQEIVYAQDDAQRGALTFDAVQSYYMRLRPVLDEQLHIWKKMAAERAVLPPTGKEKGKENTKNTAAETADIVPPANIQLPFLQLLLYRLLVFASFSGDHGQVELLTAFQQFVEQYGTGAADYAFELVFLRKASMLNEGDTLDLPSFVSHVRANSIESTYRPSIFEPPAVRISKTPTQMRLKPSKPAAGANSKQRPQRSSAKAVIRRSVK